MRGHRPEKVRWPLTNDNGAGPVQVTALFDDLGGAPKWNAIVLNAKPYISLHMTSGRATGESYFLTITVRETARVAVMARLHERGELPLLSITQGTTCDAPRRHDNELCHASKSSSRPEFHVRQRPRGDPGRSHIWQTSTLVPPTFSAVRYRKAPLIIHNGKPRLPPRIKRRFHPCPPFPRCPPGRAAMRVKNTPSRSARPAMTRDIAHARLRHAHYPPVRMKTPTCPSAPIAAPERLWELFEGHFHPKSARHVCLRGPRMLQIGISKCARCLENAPETNGRILQAR
jgi:hypothetical protein